MKKKVLGLVMAIAMTLSLAAPAFAANYYTNTTESSAMEQSLTFNAITFVPTVKLYVPTFTGNPVVLNPYKIQFTGTNNKLADQSVTGTATPVQDQYKQVICPVYAIKNMTDAKLNYTVEATTTPTGLTLQDNAVSATETEKAASLQLVVATSETSKSDYDTGNYGKPANEQVLDQWDVSKYEVLKLANGAVTSEEAIEKSLAACDSTNKENYLLFQFQGTMTKNPAVAWTGSDKVDCVVKFTFTPESANDYVASSVIDRHTILITDDTDGTPSASSDIEVKLPSHTTPDITTLTSYGAPSTATYAEEPNWTIVSSGALSKAGLEIADDVLTVDPATACTRLPHDGSSAAGKDYKIVLSFMDGHDIPRTLEFKIKLARS